jgi:hypothetical protein
VVARATARGREGDEHVGELEAHGVGGDLGRAGARPDALDLVGELGEEHALELRAVADDSSSETPARRTVLMTIGALAQPGTNSEPRRVAQKAPRQQRARRQREHLRPAAERPGEDGR